MTRKMSHLWNSVAIIRMLIALNLMVHDCIMANINYKAGHLDFYMTNNQDLSIVVSRHSARSLVDCIIKCDMLTSKSLYFKMGGSHGMCYCNSAVDHAASIHPVQQGTWYYASLVDGMATTEEDGLQDIYHITHPSGKIIHKSNEGSTATTPTVTSTSLTGGSTTTTSTVTSTSLTEGSTTTTPTVSSTSLTEGSTTSTSTVTSPTVTEGGTTTTTTQAVTSPVLTEGSTTTTQAVTSQTLPENMSTTTTSAVTSSTTVESISTTDTPLLTDCFDNAEGVVTGLHVGRLSYDAYCKSGWTVFQLRKDGSVDFFRNWTMYEEGFGSVYSEYWLGLKYIHALTENRNCGLGVKLQTSTATCYIFYREFNITGPDDNYRLHVRGYDSIHSTLIDSLQYQDGQQFTTFDKDNDAFDCCNCAVQYHGAWWYDVCSHTNLNGLYMDTETQNPSMKGIVWQDHTLNIDGEFSFRTSTMALICTTTGDHEHL